MDLLLEEALRVLMLFRKKIELNYIHKYYHISYTIHDKMRQIIKTIMVQLNKSTPINIPLGRWNIDYCSKKTDTKIDLANEDHCGPCGQYNKDILKVKHTKSIVCNKNKNK